MGLYALLTFDHSHSYIKFIMSMGSKLCAFMVSYYFLGLRAKQDVFPTDKHEVVSHFDLVWACQWILLQMILPDKLTHKHNPSPL